MVAGFYNMNCGQPSKKVESKPDFVIVSSGAKIEGTIDFKGDTFLAGGVVDKINITNTAGKTTNLKAKEIRSFTRHVNGLPLTFERLPSIDNDEERFLFLLNDGKIKLYQNLKVVDVFIQSQAKYIKKYVLNKEGQEPIAIDTNNFEEYYDKFLSDSAALRIFIENNPSKKNYENLPELVKVYNDSLN